MDFEDYKTKIQKVSKILQQAKCPEDVLNSRDIDYNTEFQYLCLNYNINSELTNEVIARLAQNGNKNIVEENVRNISIDMWNELFNKNKETKDIFIRNFKEIVENTGILTYRDIENFIGNDEDIQNVLYDNIALVIRKLCSYDRASLIQCLQSKEGGVNVIRENLELFFKKGEYDISTTYSKIVVALSNISEISREEVLEISSRYLNEMLERETAVDNETNVLLSWVYDSLEEAHLYPEQRAEIQENIDKAILENFDGILDKTNYDKETIKILKLFPCTHERFSTNKNMFIENSSKLLHMTKIYDLEIEKESMQAEKLKDVEAIPFCEVTERCSENNENPATHVDASDSNDNIVDILVKSNLDETNKIIDKVVSKVKKDDTIAWKGLPDAPVENNLQKTQVFRLQGKFDIKIDFGAEDCTEYIVAKDCQNVNNEEISTEPETSLTIIDEKSNGLNRMLCFVKGVFKKIKYILSKGRAERLGE